MTLFFLAVAVSYGVDLAPRYLAALSRGDIVVHSTARQFRRECTEPSTATTRCTDAYQIPASVLSHAEAVGLGMFVSATEIYCATKPTHRIRFGGKEDTSRVLELMKTYQVVDLRALRCEDDLVVEAWGPLVYSRSGHVGAPIIVGKSDNVLQVKRLVEFFAGQIHLLLAMTLLACLLLRVRILLPLVRAGDLQGPFSRSLVAWSAFALVKSGITEVLLPIFALHFPYVRIANFFSELAHVSPALAASSGKRWSKHWVFCAFVFVFAVLAFSPWFGRALAPAIGVCAVLSFVVAVRRKSTALNLFAIACGIESLKVVNFGGLPYGSVTLIFATLLIVAEFLDGVRKGARTADLLHWIRSLRVSETREELLRLLEEFRRKFELSNVAILDSGESDKPFDKNGEGLIPIVNDGMTVGALTWKRSAPGRRNSFNDDELQMAVQFVVQAIGHILWLERLRERSVTAVRMAHDIRAPLAAMKIASENLTAASDRRGVVLASAVKRICEIADAILEDDRSSGSVNEQDSWSVDVNADVQSIVEEFQTRFQSHATLSFTAKLAGERERVIAVGNSREFRRILSNLLTNSVEAMTSQVGSIEVSVTVIGASVAVRVTDTGKGIPPELLDHVVRKGGSYGKQSGNGLGLFHSRQLINSWGGSLEISSMLGKGTSVLLRLRDRHGADRVQYDAVLIDNDPLIRSSWALSAEVKGKSLRTFPSESEFWAVEPTVAFDSPLFIDRFLASGDSGVRFAAAARAVGFTDIKLASGSAANVPLPSWLPLARKNPPWNDSRPS